jgi:nucleoside-diphosphate-sugar epimerase
VGGRVAAQLRAAGHEVVTIARDPAKAGALVRLGVQVHRGDLGEPASLRGPMRGADGVFHIAGWYKLGARDPAEGERVNVEGTRRVLECMRELGIARGVYTSTLAIHGDTHGRLVDEMYRFDGPFESAYDLTKWRAHREVAEPMMRAGLPLVIVQPGLIYGPGDTSSVRTTLIQFLTRKLPLVPAGAAYCWAHVDDIARGHVLAMERGRTGESYHLAGPPSTLLDALALASRWSGVPLPRFVAPPWLLRALAAAMTPLAAVLPVDEQVHPETLRVMAGATYLGSAGKAARELDWTARPLETGLRATLLHEMELLGMTPPGGAKP